MDPSGRWLIPPINSGQLWAMPQNSEVFLSRTRILAVTLHPIENHRVGFFRRLPEKSVRLAFQDFHLRAGNALDENFRLGDVIAADRVRLADKN